MSYTKEEKWLLDIKHKGQVNKPFFDDLEQLRSGVPLDYLIGYSDFLSCRIWLDNSPLVPRTETEYWVEQTFEEVRSRAQTKEMRILDIFSGSGCIGVALLKHVEHVSVMFAEMRADLIPTIQKNIRENKVNKNSHYIVESDMFSQIIGTFDYIYANPPYIDKERNTAEESVVENEPHSALFASEEGLYFVKKLIVEGPKYLEPGGVLFIEFDSWQKEDILSYLDSYKDHYKAMDFLDDQFGHPRVLRLETRK